MTKKYWVPALERANDILQLLGAQPGQLKLMDLSRRLDIHKSSMFSLLHTLEALGWIIRDPQDTYRLGAIFSEYGHLYLQQHNLVDAFQREAVAPMTLLGETIQLASLDATEVLYVAKVEAPTPVRLVSDPGMRLPAHVTALGKAILAGLDDHSVRAKYEFHQLQALTPFSITQTEVLIEQLPVIRQQGYALDQQEAVVGFICIAAPVQDEQGNIIAAVSTSMPIHQWDVKHEKAISSMKQLASRLSQGIYNPYSIEGVIRS